MRSSRGIPGVPLLYENPAACATELGDKLGAANGKVFSDGERCDLLLTDEGNAGVTKCNSLVDMYL